MTYLTRLESFLLRSHIPLNWSGLTVCQLAADIVYEVHYSVALFLFCLLLCSLVCYFFIVLQFDYNYVI